MLPKKFISAALLASSSEYPFCNISSLVPCLSKTDSPNLPTIVPDKPETPSVNFLALAILAASSPAVTPAAAMPSAVNPKPLPPIALLIVS